MKELTADEVLEHGIRAVHHEMDSGERRYRLVSDAGSSYILTQANASDSWQKSHFHKEKKEYYVVECGWVLIARYENGQLSIFRLNPDEPCFIPAGVMHNIFMPAGTILHTIKYGTTKPDWHSATELDQLLEKTDITDYCQNQ